MNKLFELQKEITTVTHDFYNINNDVNRENENINNQKENKQKNERSAI